MYGVTTAARARAGMTVTMDALPSRDLSPNAYHAMHRWEQTRAMEAQRDTWMALLRAALLPPFPRFEGRVDIAVTITGTGYQMDTDAWCLNRAWKALLDVLTDPRARKTYGMGIIPDDSPKHVRSFRVAVEPEGQPSTTLEIVPVAEEAKHGAKAKTHGRH